MGNRSLQRLSELGAGAAPGDAAGQADGAGMPALTGTEVESLRALLVRDALDHQIKITDDVWCERPASYRIQRIHWKRSTEHGAQPGNTRAAGQDDGSSEQTPSNAFICQAWPSPARGFQILATKKGNTFEASGYCY